MGMAERNRLFPRVALASRIVRIGNQFEERPASPAERDYGKDDTCPGICIRAGFEDLWHVRSGSRGIGQIDIMSHHNRFPKQGMCSSSSKMKKTLPVDHFLNSSNADARAFS
jgi:hypothetical protein